FQWSLTKPETSTAELSDPTAVNPSFNIDKPGTYIAQLIVNDGKAGSAPDTTTVTTENSPPVADAGPDQTVSLGATVQLEGSGSTDADGDLLTYAWSLITTPTSSGAQLSDPAAPNPTFVADKPGTYIAQLIVNDGTVGSTPDTVVITTENSRPVADAGQDQKVTVGDTVQLDGGGSADVDGDPLSFSWSFTNRPGGSSAGLSDPNAVNPTFVADVAGTHIVQLIVDDGQLGSDPDTAMITVEVSSPPTPVITGISSTSASVGDQLTITGTNLLPASGGCPRVTLTDQSGNTINAPVISCTATSIVFVVPAGAGTGPITVTINGQDVPIPSPDGPAKVTVVPSSDFSLGIQPATANVIQGASVTYTIDLLSSSDFTGLAALTVAGLPAGVTATLNPSSLTAGQRSDLTISAAETAALGAATATIAATAPSDAGPITRSVPFGLSVEPGGRTALIGRFMLIDGPPLQGVKLTLAGQTTETDSGGNFQFLDPPAGMQNLAVDT
ncbi:MAG: PKD domain-containing protein, partial [bacterium]